VVHGPLTAVLLMELVRRNCDRKVQEFSFRGIAPLFDLGPFRLMCTGADTGGNQLALEAQGPDGVTAMTANAEVAAVA
jgi:3-methylfumaryl-CoA hydratase